MKVDMKAIVILFAITLPCLVLERVSLGCEGIFATLGRDGVTFASLLDNQITKREFGPVTTLFRSVPEQTILRLVQQSQNEALPFGSRQFALESVYNLTSSKQVIPHWLMNDILSLASEHIDAYLKEQRDRLEGVLPEDFKPTKSLTNESMSAPSQKSDVRVNSDLFVNAKKSMLWLARVPEGKTLLLEKLGDLSLLHSDMIKNRDAHNTTLRRELVVEFYAIASALGHESTPTLAASILSKLSLYSDAIELAFWFIDHFHDEEQLIKILSRDARIARRLDQNTMTFISLRLGAIESCADSALLQNARSISRLRLLRRTVSADQALHDRVTELLETTKDRFLMKKEIYQLHILVLELHRRLEHATTPFFTNLVGTLLQALAAETRSIGYSDYVQSYQGSASALTPFRLLNDVLAVILSTPGVSSELKKDTAIASTLAAIALDDKRAEKIYGPLNGKDAKLITDRNF